MPVPTRIALWLLLTGALFGAAGCDFYEAANFEAGYVVEGYLEAGEALRPVRLSRPATIDSTYDFDAAAVSGAEVHLERLNDAGDVVERIAYAEATDDVGIYFPERRERVRPLHTYRLRATVPGGRQLSATTTVPDTFRVISGSAEALPYPPFGAASPEILQLRLSLRPAPGEPTYFILSTTALEPAEENLVPLVRQLLEESDDDDLDMEDLITNPSPILNESNYELNADGTVMLDVPWIAVVFYGPNRFAVRMLDEALNNLIRTQQVQQGGFSFSPGEIPNAIDNVDGGTGVFGSYAEANYVLQVLRPGEEAQGD